MHTVASETTNKNMLEFVISMLQPFGKLISIITKNAIRYTNFNCNGELKNNNNNLNIQDLQRHNI